LTPSANEQAALVALSTSRPAVATGIADALTDTEAKVTQARLEATQARAAAEGLGVTAGMTAPTLERERAAALDANNEAVRVVREAQGRNLHRTNWAEYEPLQNTMNQASRDFDRKQQQHEAAKAAEAAEQKARDAAAKAQADKTRLLNAVRFGPLSASAPRRLADDVAGPIVAQFKDYPELASSALDVAATAAHPEVIARGVAVLGPLEAKGFAKSDRRYNLPPDARKMARNALEMGGRLGGDHFERMEAFYRNPPDPDPNHIVRGGLIKMDEKAQAYNRDLTNGLVGPGGEVDFTAPAAQATLDKLKFHPDNLAHPQFALIDNVEKVRRLFTEPAAGNPYKAELAGVRKPGGANAEGLVRRTLGLPGGRELTALDGKRAVVGALLTPFAQGPAGSCFATGPCLKKVTTDPLAVMKDFSAIAQTGKLSRTGRPDLPAVTTLPANQNALVRSWEYTVASMGARETRSTEKQEFETALFGGFTRQVAAGGKSLADLAADCGADWPAKQDRIKQAVGDAFTFSYDSTAVRAGASVDGVSSAGAWVMKHRMAADDERDLTSESGFKTALKGVVKTAVGADRVLHGKIDTLIDSGDFTTCIAAAYNRDQPDGSPWKMGGGGQEKDSTKVLFGGTPAKHPLRAGGGTSVGGNKPATLLADMVRTLGSRSDMVTVGAEGIHTMNFLPNDPSLQALKTGDVARNVQDRLLTPAEAIADTALETERAQFVYTKALETFFDDDNALKAAKLQRPGVSLKPMHLRNYILDKAAGKITADQVDAFLLKELNFPQFVIGDTNWGDARDHKLMVVAPDPASPTGAPKVWKKDAFSGAMTPETDRWANADWTHTG
jgi:hypothetical protein